MNYNLKKAIPWILSIIGSVGVIVTPILAVRESRKATEKIEQKKEELNTDNLTKKDLVKAVVPVYSGAIASGALSVGCIIGAQAMNAKQIAGLASMVTAGYATYYKYRNKIKEKFGPKFDNDILKEAEKKKETPPWESENERTETRELFYLDIFDDYFWSTRLKVKEAEMALNRMFRLTGLVTFADFVELLDIPVSSEQAEHFKQFVWSAENFGNDMWIPFHYPVEKDKNHNPFIHLSMLSFPSTEYSQEYLGLFDPIIYPGFEDEVLSMVEGPESLSQVNEPVAKFTTSIAKGGENCEST